MTKSGDDPLEIVGQRETRLVPRKRCKTRFDYQYLDTDGKWKNMFKSEKRWVRPKEDKNETN